RRSALFRLPEGASANALDGRAFRPRQSGWTSTGSTRGRRPRRHLGQARLGPYGRPVQRCRRVLLDAQFMSVLARLVVLRATEDHLLERDALRRDEMEVLLLLDGTGRDHGPSAPDNSPHDGRLADVGHPKTP